MNTVTINFIPCYPTPENGYNLKWRVVGSGDPYTDEGNFTTSPIQFSDSINPDGTCYEGILQPDCGSGAMGNEIPWSTPCEESGFDNSSCGSSIYQITASLTYTNLGFFDLHVSGALHVNLNYDVLGRPNRFTLYENGVIIDTSGWKGVAPYAGPWGISLNTPTTGTIDFAPVLGNEYKLLIEVGPAGPPPYDVSDNFFVAIDCDA
jgi:hypothetical protein